jgi:hypothetical protein
LSVCHVAGFLVRTRRIVGLFTGLFINIRTSRSSGRSCGSLEPLYSKYPIAVIRPNLHEAREVGHQGLGLEVQLIDAPYAFAWCKRDIALAQLEQLHSTLPYSP